MTGAVSELVVVDLDGEGALDWAKRHLPPTGRVATADGEHWYYEHPGGVVKCAAGIAPGIDIRGDGGYVVGRGSIHPSGAIYTVAEAPNDFPMFDLTWFDRPDYPSYWFEEIGEGTRNNTAYRRAAWLLNDGKRTASEAAEALSEWNRRTCRPPLDDAEVRKVFHSALKGREGNSVSSVSMSWDTPDPLDDPDLPPFPVHALPQAISAYVKAVAESLQVPVDLAAMLALAIGATAAARRFEVHVQADHVEPTNLWAVCVAPSGTRKSALFRQMMFPLIEHQRETAERLVGGDDASPEAVAQLLNDNGGRIAILSPEGGLFDFMEGRRDGGAGLDVYVKGHAGDDHYVDRITRDPLHLVKPALTMGLTVQPEVLSDIMARRRFRGRGVVARMLFAIPKGLVGQRKIRTSPIPEPVRGSYLAAVSAALSAGADQITRLRLSADALDDWCIFAESVERRQAEGEDLSHIADWASKLAGAVARIAGVIHVGGGANGNHIETDTIRASIEIAKYLVTHALAAFSQMGANPHLTGARLLVKWFKAEGVREFTRRDAMRRHQSRFTKAADLDGPLELLIARGHISEVEQRQQRPGRPTERYAVNPQTLGHK